MKHTPGPWLWCETKWGIHVQRRQEGGFPVIGTSRKQERADARLIAKAPEMYEALRYLSAECLGVADMAREVIGNTNANILHQRAEEARALLKEIDQ